MSVIKYRMSPTDPWKVVGGASDGGGGGSSFLVGTVPPTGAIGSDGDFYIDTVGAKLYGPKSGTTWPVALVGIPPAGIKWDEFR